MTKKLEGKTDPAANADLNMLGLGGDPAPAAGIQQQVQDLLDGKLPGTPAAGAPAEKLYTESEVNQLILASETRMQKMMADMLAGRLAALAEDAEEAIEAGTPPPYCSGKKCTIIIDDVEGLPNFEVVSLNGHVLQIKRGVEVDVWEEYVEILRHAISSFEPTLEEIKAADAAGRPRPRRNRNSIPWHLIKGPF